jgi:hypothetical protein
MRPRRSPCSTTGPAAATMPSASAGCRRCSTSPAAPGSAPTWPTPRPWPRSSAAVPPAPSTTAYWQRNPRNRPIRPASPLTPGGRCWSAATWSWTPPRAAARDPGRALRLRPHPEPALLRRRMRHQRRRLGRHPGPGGDIPPGALNQRSAPVARADRCDEVAVRTPNLPLQLRLPGQIASPCGPCSVGVKVTRAPGFVGEGEADRGDDAAEDLEADGIVIDAQLFIRAHGRMASAKGVHQARRHSRRQLRAALSDAAGSSPAASADLAPIREFLGRWTMPSWPAWPSRRPRRRAISARHSSAAHLGGRPSGGRMGAMAGPPWRRGPDHSAGTASTASATA